MGETCVCVYGWMEGIQGEKRGLWWKRGEDLGGKGEKGVESCRRYVVVIFVVLLIWAWVDVGLN